MPIQSYLNPIPHVQARKVRDTVRFRPINPSFLNVTRWLWLQVGYFFFSALIVTRDTFIKPRSMRLCGHDMVRLKILFRSWEIN